MWGGLSSHRHTCRTHTLARGVLRAPGPEPQPHQWPRVCHTGATHPPRAAPNPSLFCLQCPQASQGEPPPPHCQAPFQRGPAARHLPCPKAEAQSCPDPQPSMGKTAVGNLHCEGGLSCRSQHHVLVPLPAPSVGPWPQKPRKTSRDFSTLTIALKREHMATAAQCPARMLKMLRKTSMNTVDTDAELTNSTEVRITLYSHPGNQFRSSPTLPFLEIKKKSTDLRICFFLNQDS